MALNWSKIYKSYKGRWVALREAGDPNVLSSGKTLGEVLKKAEKKGFQNPLVFQVPKKVLLEDLESKRMFSQSKEMFEVPREFFEPLPKSIIESFNNPK